MTAKDPPAWAIEKWRRLPRVRLATSDLGKDPISTRLAYALKNKVAVEMLYAEPGNKARRTVRPKYIERVINNRVGTLYMSAYDESEAEDRMFRLDRIREARVPSAPGELCATAVATQEIRASFQSVEAAQRRPAAPTSPVRARKAASSSTTRKPKAATSSSRSRPHSTPDHDGRAAVASWERPASSGATGRPQEPTSSKREQPSAASPRSVTSASRGCLLPAISVGLLVMAIEIGVALN